jgi:outer membrane protein OmpA-like peptidoglycan-associated protein
MTPTLRLASLACTAALFGACATLAPPDLVEARGAYTTAAAGPAATLSPTALYDAQKALERANHEFAENGNSAAVHDLAYVAMRKTELADVEARIETDRRRIAAAAKAGVVVRDQQLKSGQVALADSQEQLRSQRASSDALAVGMKAENDAQGQALQRSEVQAEVEKQGRLTAEAKLAGAMKDLATIAAIKEDERGMVITLSGSVLFPSGKSTLLESAKTKLTQVAEALKAQSDDKNMIVEGHTDSRGSDAVNQPLSLARATSVRDFLVGRGVDATRISAVGRGSTAPLLDNKSAENRANNRRVEIVITTRAMTAN